MVLFQKEQMADYYLERQYMVFPITFMEMTLQS